MFFRLFIRLPGVLKVDISPTKSGTMSALRRYSMHD